MPDDPRALAALYHTNLPERLRAYLNGRGISDAVIDLHRLGWNGECITIPITDQNGLVTFFKLAKDPEDPSDAPKIMTSTGGSVELYGWERVLAKPEWIVICEGEFDRLVLESQGIPAVTSTGGAGSFRAEWTDAFTDIRDVFVCYDRDDAGERGARRVASFMPRARVVTLPEEVGPAGDVTDFFVRLGRSRDEFLELLSASQPLPPAPEDAPTHRIFQGSRTPPEVARRVSLIKATVAIDVVVSRHVDLRRTGQSLRGRCPFHDDRQPSLMVYPESGTFHCFGCGLGGDVITFIRAIDGISFLQALDVLEHLSTTSYGLPGAE